MDVYREEILEHWQNPQNYGEMKNADLVIDRVNPLCGDEIIFYFKITNTKYPITNNKYNRKRERIIEDVSFVGKGCAISIASASILTEAIKGQKVERIKKITGEDVLALLGGPVAPARLKCAFLPLEALRELNNEA